MKSVYPFAAAHATNVYAPPEFPQTDHREDNRAKRQAAKLARWERDLASGATLEGTFEGGWVVVRP